MYTGSYGWFRCEKVKWRSKIKSVFNFSQYNLAPLRRIESKAAAPAGQYRKWTHGNGGDTGKWGTNNTKPTTKYNAIEVRK